MSGGKIIVVCGSTASGKTALAVDLAKRYNGEVVSADSVAIYKGLDVGSAKPTKEETRGVKHYMIDVVSPFDEFSVSDYENAALPIINDILSRGKLPIICGGTGFYINSLLYKMSYGNSKGNTDIRNKYEKIAAEEGNEKVYEILKTVDPVTAEKLHPNDKMRVIRALEIFEASGVRKSDIKDEMIPRFDFIAIMPTYDRETLYNRINKRVDGMFRNGLEEEVEGLLKSGLTLENQSMQGIGYKETAEAILSGSDMPVETIKLNTRHYAKRQITFFKRFQNLFAVDNLGDGSFEKVCKIADNFLKI